MINFLYFLLKALLTRLAQTPAGSRELLAANCIGYLTQCHFIDLRPDHHDDRFMSGSHGNHLDMSGGGFVPTVSDRYQQLLLPLLKLLLTLLTCPGAQRSEVKSQVNFVNLENGISKFFFIAGDISNRSTL